MPSLVDQHYEHVPLDAVQPHPDNPRRGNVAAIGDSVAENGFYGAVVAQKSTGHILAGNHRWLAARDKGLDTVPVIWLDVDDNRAARILLNDNRTNDLATYDEADLLRLLEGLAVTDSELAGTGYDYDALDDMRAALTPDEETLPPGETRAQFAETPEEEAARAATRGVNPSLAAAGLRELVLVYTADNHEQVMRMLGAYRARATDEATNADIVRAALAAGDADAITEWLGEQ